MLMYMLIHSAFSKFFVSSHINSEPLQEIPSNLKLHTLIIDGDNTISEIPDDLKVHILKIHGFNTINKIHSDIKIHTLNILQYQSSVLLKTTLI